MVCSECGAQTQPAYKFCEACGNPLNDTLSVQAPSQVGKGQSCVCGSTIFDADGYCVECGQKPKPATAIESVTVDDHLAWASHPGRTHPENQDAAVILRLPDDYIVLAVADGVSQSDRARDAAHTAVNTIAEVVPEQLHQGPEAALQMAIAEANERLKRLPYVNKKVDEPQATIVAAIVHNQTVWLGWLGDSRLYLLGQDQAVQISIDDSWLNDALAEGIPFEQAAKDPDAHCITQCLGMRDAEPQINIASANVTPGSWVMLCSDGLWNYFPEPGALAGCVADHLAAGQAIDLCTSWVNQANAAGGHDNITVAALRV